MRHRLASLTAFSDKLKSSHADGGFLHMARIERNRSAERIRHGRASVGLPTGMIRHEFDADLVPAGNVPTTSTSIERPIRRRML